MKDNVASIQFLRFVAAALVVAFHLTLGLDKYYGGVISDPALYTARFGAVGVHIFFVISGFVMVYASFPSADSAFSPAKFLIRRFIRIYPIYWIYAAVYIGFHTLFLSGYGLSFDQYVAALLLFPGAAASIIGPGWTLAFEVYFYLCFGIVMALGLRRGLPVLTLIFVVLIAIRFLFRIDVNQPNLHVFTNTLLLEFLFGAWIAYFVVTGVRVSMPVANAMLLLCLAIFGAGFIFDFSRLPTALTWGVPSALLVAGFVHRERNGQLPALMKRYSWLGDSSYSLYLLHILLIDATLSVAVAIMPRLESLAGLAVMFSLLLLLYIAISIICYDFVERKIVVTLQNFVKGRTQFSGTKQTRSAS